MNEYVDAKYNARFDKQFAMYNVNIFKLYIMHSSRW